MLSTTLSKRKYHRLTIKRKLRFFQLASVPAASENDSERKEVQLCVSKQEKYSIIYKNMHF
jgi:hypothetical protein